MSVPAELLYTTSHEWIRIEGDVATCGITHHAQDQLGDVVYVDMPEEGDEAESGEGLAEIESVKAVSDIYAPISGEVAGVNETIEDTPELVNKDPYGAGWLFKIRFSELPELMDAAAYQAHLAASE